MPHKITIVKKRIHFLSDSSVNYYFGLPSFSDDDRQLFFNLSNDEKKVAESIRNLKSRIHFILMLGYFKAKTILFDLKSESINHDDIHYIAGLYDQKVNYEISVSRPIHQRHLEYVLALTGWKQYKSAAYRDALLDYAKQLAKRDCKAMFIFTELTQYLIDQKIEMPKYSEFQLIISEAIQHEEARLGDFVIAMPEKYQRGIKQLIDNKTSSDSMNLCDVAQAPVSMSNEEIQQEIKRFNSVAELFECAAKLLKDIDLPPESIKYYASLVDYYGQGKLKRMSDPLVPLYIFCYLHTRCKRINDNLIETFRHKISKYWSKANDYAQEQLQDDQALYFKTRPKLASILNDCKDPKNQKKPISTLNAQISNIGDDNFDQAVDYMANSKKHHQMFKWQHIIKSEKYFKLNLRKIFTHLEIDYGKHKTLAEASSFLRDFLKKPDEHKKLIPYSDFPVECIPDTTLEFIVSEDDTNYKSMHYQAYEFFIYDKINQGLNGGEIAVKDSFGYGFYEDELVDLATLDDKELNLELLNTPINEQLSALEDLLESQIKTTNTNIKEGVNTAIDIKSYDKRKWTLPYSKDPVEVNHKVFDMIDVLDIADVFAVVDQELHFLSEFRHIIDKKVKGSLDKTTLSATIIAKATNHGIYKMSTLSDYSYDQLYQCSKSYLSLESINNACDVISDAIHELPIFNHYNINGVVHGGIDGQKYATKHRTFKSRNSPKYFYLGSGISSTTLVVNHIPANATVFGADEHESRFIFDLVYNNQSEVQPEIISTDSHGSNNVNFALLHFIDRAFAPCYKQINNKENMLYGFNSPSSYKEHLIRPKHKISKDKIINQWDNIKQIIASLVLKKSNQSILIRKLTDNKFKNETKEALWAYNDILRSEYIYRYIDDEQLRKSVRKALNRTEAYHQLKRTVATVNSDKLNGKNDECLTINDACARLLCEVILYYNATILSGVLTAKEKDGKLDEVERIKKVSIAAWSHVNLHGNYTFKNRSKRFNWNQIIKKAASAEIQETQSK